MGASRSSRSHSSLSPPSGRTEEVPSKWSITRPIRTRRARARKRTALRQRPPHDAPADNETDSRHAPRYGACLDASSLFCVESETLETHGCCCEGRSLMLKGRYTVARTCEDETTGLLGLGDCRK